jgi:hypothetical protein
MEYTKYIKEAYAKPLPSANTRSRAGELSRTAVVVVVVVVCVCVCVCVETVYIKCRLS